MDKSKSKRLASENCLPSVNGGHQGSSVRGISSSEFLVAHVFGLIAVLFQFEEEHLKTCLTFEGSNDNA